MGLRVVGAGLGRTGTHSLKIALEQLLGGPCYHMVETFSHPEHVPAWAAAAQGNLPDWRTLFAGYRAAVDWPTAAYWRELADAYPDALVLLSVRPADEWWKSANQTIFQVLQRPPKAAPEGRVGGPDPDWTTRMLANRFTPRWREESEAKRAFERHNDEVRRTIPASRLLEWRPSDGWGSICSALKLPVPETPFPHANSTGEFRAMTGLDKA